MIESLNICMSYISPMEINECSSPYEILSQVIKKCNELTDKTNEMENALIELKRYIELYFSEENIKKYVDELFNNLIESGYFETFFNELIESQTFNDFLKVLLDVKLNKINFSKSINNQTNTAQLIDVIFSYYYNQDSLFYDNLTALNKNMSVNSDNKKGIDCSTFVLLSLYSVYFSNSRYSNGGTRDSNFPECLWGVDMYSYDEVLINGVMEYRRYSNMLARFMYDNNMTFIQSKDWKNVRSGDVLFWGDGVIGGESFMNIYHCAFVISVDNNTVKYIDANNNRDKVIELSTFAIGGDTEKNICIIGRTYNNGYNPLIDEKIIIDKTEFNVENEETTIDTNELVRSGGYFSAYVESENDISNLYWYFSLSSSFKHYFTKIYKNTYVSNIRVDSGVFDKIYIGSDLNTISGSLKMIKGFYN